MYGMHPRKNELLNGDIAYARLHLSHSSSFLKSSHPNFPSSHRDCRSQSASVEIFIPNVTNVHFIIRKKYICRQKNAGFYFLCCFYHRLREEKSTGLFTLFITAAKTYFTCPLLPWLQAFLFQQVSTSFQFT